MTRRRAILLSLSIPAGAAIEPAWAFAAREFWNEKPSADWTAAEIQELLTASPWAKEASVSYNGGPGNLGHSAGYGGMGRMSRRSVGVPTGTTNPGTGVEHQQYKALVRWETALPIRLASHSNSTDDPAANYIINLIGDLPMLGSHKDEDETQREQRVEMLKEYTRLERKHDPIYLAQMKFASASETLFYFPRLDPIYPDDRQVTFTTKLGPLEVKAKFVLKDMMYQGKLAL